MVGGQQETSSEQARTRLVAALRQSGMLRTDAVARAFLTVPREVFVPVFYQQERQPGYPWVPCTADSYAEPGAWIDAIYRDQPLVTLIDAHNTPISSSSAPSVMAMMLEALEMHPGMRVLEIGTGSGYNAALLATLTGDARLITTIDVEESLVRAATQILHRVIGLVETQVGDGRLGVPSARGLYERIIVTASSSDIPPAWYDQLAPGGRLVMPFQGSLRKGSLLCIEKKPDGEAEGHFEASPLYFLSLRSSVVQDIPASPHTSVSTLLRQPVTQRIEVEASETTAAMFEERAFHWSLQWVLPGITFLKSTVVSGSSAGKSVITFTDTTSTVIQLFLTEGSWRGNQRGGEGLWDAITQAYANWVKQGRPGIEAYSVGWQTENHRFQLRGPCERWL